MRHSERHMATNEDARLAGRAETKKCDMPIVSPPWGDVLTERLATAARWRR